MHRTTSHLYQSDIPAAGYQRDGKEEKAACSPLCHVPKVNIQQDRTHGFAPLFFLITLHPAAVQRTGNASWLLTSVSLTFYQMVDSAAEVSEYPPVSPLTIVLPAGSQRSGRGQNKLSSIPHYRSTRGSQRSGRGRDKLPSILHYRSTRGSQRSGRGRDKLSPTRHYRSTRW